MATIRKFRDFKQREEDADIVKGKLPPGFVEPPNVAVSHAAALGILGFREKLVESMRAPEIPMDKEVVKKCIDHLHIFQGPDGFQEANNKRNEIKEAHPELELTEFEIAQLVNLRPSSIDEARVLITSLERIESDHEKESLMEVLIIVNPQLRSRTA